MSVNVTLKNEVADLENKLENGLVKYRNLEAALNKVKGEQSEQARLIKKLQRKLLLVTKERDSNRVSSKSRISAKSFSVQGTSEIYFVNY